MVNLNSIHHSLTATSECCGVDSKQWWKHELLPLGEILVSAEYKSFQIRCMFELYTWTHILHFAHYCLHQLYSKQEWKKGISVPALHCVIKIHKCHHVTVWHHCCTAHNPNSDLAIALATCSYSTNRLSWHYYIEKCGLPANQPEQNEYEGLKNQE